MAIQSYVGAELVSNTDTFSDWFVITNQIIGDMATNVVTIGNNNVGDITTDGNLSVSNTVYIGSKLSGGELGSPQQLTVETDVLFDTSNVTINDNLNLIGGTGELNIDNGTMNIRSSTLVINSPSASVNSEISFTNTATFDGNVVLNNDVSLNGNTQFNSSINFTNPITFEDAADFNDQTSFNNVATFSSNVTFSDDITVEANTSLSIQFIEKSNTTSSQSLFLLKARNNSGSLAAVQQNDSLGRILFGGYNGSFYQTGASISSNVRSSGGSLSNTEITYSANLHTFTGNMDFSGVINNDAISPFLLNDSTLSANSTTQAATQQSVKTFVETSAKLKSETAVVASGNSLIQFNNIPNDVNMIIIEFYDLSTQGDQIPILVQIGDSGGIENSNYSSFAHLHGSFVVGGDYQTTNGFVVPTGQASATAIGHMTLTKCTGNSWLSSFSVGIRGFEGSDNFGGSANGGGLKTLSSALDRVRITRDGSGTFDEGIVNIKYQ